MTLKKVVGVHLCVCMCVWMCVYICVCVCIVNLTHFLCPGLDAEEMSVCECVGVLEREEGGDVFVRVCVGGVCM